MTPTPRAPSQRPPRLQGADGDLDSGTREIIAFVVHELKSPLHAISSWIEVLKRAAPGSDQSRRAIAGIEQGTAAQAELLSRLGELSGMVSGDFKVELRPLDAAALVGGAVESLRVEAELGRKQVEFAPCPGELPILGDAGWLRQVLGNLFDNAIKFTHAHGRIGVSTARQGSEIEIRISDSGRGIAPDQTERIFDRFYHRGNHGDGADDGKSWLEMGLGLYVVRLIVEAHSGTVSAQSDGLGRGATLVVRLPLAPEGSGACGGTSTPDTPETAAAE